MLTRDDFIRFVLPGIVKRPIQERPSRMEMEYRRWQHRVAYLAMRLGR